MLRNFFILRKIKPFSLIKRACLTSECKSDPQTSILSPYSLNSSENIVIPRSRENFADLLNVTQHEAALIQADYPKLKKVYMDELKVRLKAYKKIGVGVDVLVKYPWLLTFTEYEIEKKCRILKPLPLEYKESITLLRQKSEMNLKTLVQSLCNEFELIGVNRIKYMSAKLRCEPQDICYSAAKYLFFSKIDFPRIKNILDILIGKRISPTNILNDFWIFNYRVETIATRLKTAEEANVSNLKTWMVRCKSNLFKRTLSRHRANKIVLGNLPSINEYLSERLDLPLSFSKVITDKHLEIKRMNVTKAKEVIDYVLSEGYSPMHVTRTPRILCCKLQTIQNRLEMFKKIGYQPNSLVIFCKSQAQFDKYFKNVQKKMETSNKKDSK